MKKVQLFFLALLGVVITASSIRSQTFTDVAATMDVVHTYGTDFFAGGVSFGDINQDDFCDITLTNAIGSSLSIFKNVNASKFKDRISYMGITESQRSKTVSWIDYDNDGDKDLMVINQTDSFRLWQHNGSTYTDVTNSAGLANSVLPWTSACWADFNNDGWLDVYIGVRSTTSGNLLFQNNGDGTFSDITVSAGVEDLVHMPLTISAFDFNNDGWQDIYCANDLNGGNTLFRNNGNGTFSDISVSSGANLAMANMGIAVGDYDNDGFIDLYLSNSPEGNRLLKNNGNETFSEVASTLGMTVGKICWGANFIDFDNDGDLDLFVGVSDGPTGPGDPDRINKFYKNRGNGTFKDITVEVGLGLDNDYSYGNAVGDFNNDGWDDLVVINANGTPTRLYQNSGGANHWIQVLLKGTSSNLDGFGSVIEVFNNGSHYIRTTHSSISYESQNSRINTLGLGQSIVADSIRIHWPSGIIDVLKDVPAGQRIEVVEGDWVSPRQHFVDVAPLLKIRNSYDVDFMAAGLSFIDFNGDGLDDLTLSSETGSNLAVYKNITTQFKNVTSKIGILEDQMSRAIIWADYDNDGDKDLYVANANAVSHLYRKDGPTTYVDVTAIAGLSTTIDPTMSGAFADYDNDGWLDLYVANRGTGIGNYLYHNNGDGTFTNVTTAAGVSAFGMLNLTVTWFDFNNDGYQDIYLANDLMIGNILYKNNGDGTFTDVSVSSGAGVAMANMGIALGDYNGDGFLDLFLTNGPTGNIFLKNNGNETFTDVAGTLGMTVGKICWGTNFVDYDNDGDLDLLVDVSDGPTGRGDPNRNSAFYQNNGDGTFSIPSFTWIDVDTSFHYGNAIGDYNNDGWPDIAILNAYGTNSSLWKNTGNSTNNWIKLNLVGTSSNRDAIGAVIEVTAGGNTSKRVIQSQISFQSQNSLGQIVGVGTVTTIDNITITWPSGSVSSLQNVAVNQSLTVTEGLGSAKNLAKENIFPQSFELSQNFPNPFNPSTIIKYQLPNDAFVKVEIFNVTGEKITDLVNSDQSAGYYTLNFEANKIGNGLSSGIYFYRITVNEKISGKIITNLKKMILMK